MTIKKYIFITTTIFSSLWSINSLAAEDNIIGHWEDANGNFFGEASGENNKPNILINNEKYYISNKDTGEIKLDDGQGYFQPYITDADFIWYKSNDCSGNGYLSNNDGSFIEGPFKAPPAGVIFESTPDIINKTVLMFKYSKGAVMYNSDFHSTGSIQADGKYKCEKYEFHHEHYSYDEVEVKNEILNPPKNIIGNNKYSKLRFSYENGSFAIYANALLPLKLVEKQIEPEPEKRVPFQAVANQVNIRVSASGKLRYVIANSMQPLYEGDITVSRIETGVYDITFPDNYLAHNRAADKLILTCSTNKASRKDTGRTTVGCYKLTNKSVIRVGTDWKQYPSNSDFTLGLQW